MSNHVQVRIGADTSDLKKGISGAKQSLGGFAASAGSTAKAAAKVAVAAVAAAGAIGGALVAKSMEAIDAQAKLAKQLGTTSSSMATLDRAAELSGVSMGDLSTGARTLNTRLSEAIQGTGQAVGALDKLGLKAEDLQRMTLDQKIATVNTALKESVPANERAAVAADLFGQRAGVAIATLDAGTIETASKQMEGFGLAISDVDASKIETANDAMSGVKRIAEGVTQQMAIQMAPILGGISNKLLDTAGSAGGFQDAITKAVEIGIKGAGFLANAFRGIQAVVKGLEMAFWGFSVVVNRVLQAIPESVDFVVNSAKSSINGLIDGMNKLPGIDISKMVYGESAVTKMMKEGTETAVNNLKRVSAEMHDLLMEPLPSTALDDWFQEVKATSEAAAQEVVKAQADTAALNISDLPSVDENPEVIAEREKNEKLKEMYGAYTAARLASGEDFRKTEAAQAREFSEKELAAIESAEKAKKAIRDQHIANAVAGTSKMFGDLSTLMESKHKAMFEIGKKAAQGQTVVDTYAAAQSAYKSLAGIPVIGPGLGVAAAGAAIVAGVGRLSAISSTSFGSKSVNAGAATSGSSSSISGGEAGQQAQSVSQSSTMYVEGLSGDGLMSMVSARSMAEKLLEFQKDGGTVVLSQ